MRTDNPPQKILVPVDYSEPSKRALERAVSLARDVNAKLVLLFAWAAPYAPLPIQSDELTEKQKTLFDLVRKECEETMIEFIRQIQARADDVDLSWIIVSGEPAEIILDQSKQQGVDLIIMGSHGRSNAARWFLGSVAEAVLRHSNCPVLVVPPQAQPPNKAGRD